MDELQFWKQKVVQFFHDPPAKPFAFYPGTGGHQVIAKALFSQFTRQDRFWYEKRPDWAASGADRPMLAAPRGTRQVQVRWPTRPLMTHPLWPAVFDARPVGVEQLSATAVRTEVIDQASEALEEIGDPLADWQDAAELHQAFTRLWRRFRDALIAEPGLPGGQLLWAEMPAETRTPDHSIWDHLRVTTALAFLPASKANGRAVDATDPQAPWLLRFSLRPIQRFIAEARSSRDLWTGSFLLADLTWHAMQPLVERYGHDCILYPDLRGNPLVDTHLYPEALPEQARDAGTFAAMLPARFTAVVPHGEPGGFLLPIPELARACEEGLQQRWHQLEDLVLRWLMDKARPRTADDRGRLRRIWERQHRRVITTAWSAVAWLPPERLRSADSLAGRALPAQRPGFRDHRDREDLERIDQRRERLAPWLSQDNWAHYELAREVYARTHLAWHQLERGFDYALTHHQLVARHGLRKAQAPPEPTAADEPGEKCTCCGRRQALSEAEPTSVFADRKAAMRYWQQQALDPNRTGAERLCAVCTTKRFLVEACVDDDKLVGINPIWAGRDTRLADILDRDGNKVRVPFPSTATVAAQAFIAAVVARSDLHKPLADVIAAHRRLDLPATSFPRALPRLAATASKLGRQDIGRRFLELEAEEVLFPNAIGGLQRQAKAKAKAADRRGEADEQARWTEREAGYRELADVVGKLRQAATDAGIRPPNSRIAVLAMDGDRIGSLLLGERETIQTRWRDVIHPALVKEIDAGRHPHLVAAGWPALLDSRRLCGPSLHAWISRALANFSHVIVPWVIEREFSGRLIYCGGDDLLCLVPGDEAIDLAARLQQLFSAPWVVDTQPQTRDWDWRRRDAAFDYDQASARRRFAVPVFQSDTPVRLPIADPDALHPHVALDIDQAIRPATPVDGRVIPMLGGGRSLSAGIAVGHYKTPLRQLIHRAREMLEGEAKQRAGRGAIGISHASRGGEKSRFAMRWADKDGGPGAHAALTTTIRAFGDGRLSARLPYKLRGLATEIEALQHELREPKTRERWLNGLFHQALSEHLDADTATAAYALWRQGLELHPHAPERAVAGLLLCRALAGDDEEEAT